MKKFLRRIPNNIFLFTIIFVLIFIILNCIIYSLGMMFRQRVYDVMIILTILGLVIGYMQLIVSEKTSETVTTLLIIIAAIIIVFGIVFFPIIGFVAVAAHKPEHVIVKENGKYVAYVSAFLNVNVLYFDYINPIVCGNKVKIKENYGKGGYDPFDGNHNDSRVKTYQYYDEDGKGYQD